jgi:hypothetical protein
MTVSVGLRYDRYASSLPEQGNPGTGPFATKNLYPKRNDFPVYNSWVPRFSIVYDVKGDGKLALKASYGRYRGSGGPGGSNVNPNTTKTCTYNNWDGSIPYVPIEANLSGNCSGGFGERTFGPDLDNGYMDEYSGGIELGITRDYLLRFNFVRKFDFGGTKTLNLNQPFEAYSDVRYGVDPGRDNLAGTTDDGVMEVWSIPRSYPTFSTTRERIVNLAPGEGRNQYTGLEVTFNKQLGGGWSFLASYSADFADSGNDIPQTPNALVYNWQVPRWAYSVKLNGTYDLPWGLKYGSIYTAQSGEPYSRSAQMRNALNSLVTVQVEGIAGYYDWVKIWDNRVTRVFQVNDRHTIEAAFDLFNTFNSNTVLSQGTTNGPNYGKPIQGGGFASSPILPPRIFKLGARWKF